jgi:F-type H+-transporting ATPase subunit a
MAGFRFTYIRTMVWALILSALSINVSAQTNEEHAEKAPHEEEHKLDPAKIIMDHIKDAHEFHFFSIDNEENPKQSFHAKIPLPVILYSPSKGLSFFSFSKLEENEEEGYEGYKVYEGDIYAAPVADQLVKVEALKKSNAPKEVIEKEEAALETLQKDNAVYDFSMTKNVVQMILALTILVWLMLSIAKKYRNGQGVTSAPKGWQNAIEPVITFVRDDVAKPNLGHKWEKYLPYLLTVFFFILINNIFGLIPGSANVTGNTAFTIVMGLISAVVILASSNGHFWMHILWPPGVPFMVKLILIPVELAGVLIIKPAALIIRLFANMVAGHIIILSFISLIFIFGAMSTTAGWGFSPVSILFTVFIYFIEILVAFIQAFIFTNLTAVFIGQAFEGEHHHDEADGHHAHA